jgi:hypothetical protein
MSSRPPGSGNGAALACPLTPQRLSPGLTRISTHVASPPSQFREGSSAISAGFVRKLFFFRFPFSLAQSEKAIIKDGLLEIMKRTACIVFVESEAQFHSPQIQFQRINPRNEGE